MTSSTDYSFRKFQEELRALDGNAPTRVEPTRIEPTPVETKKLSKKELEAQRLAKEKAEFSALREKYQWSVADVVSFFPEEEGIGYLQALLQAPPQKKRGRKPKADM
ncbi:2-hydroxyacyl-CoA dehydratase [Luteibacter rhizovicinus]|uniref:2-hydroxyacyl-CoA dehydratase n=1 Tax=Luteibacter rhizovicinus TaxID=242606 RepID=UPI00104CDC72|nr:2-hydroxyacyl-CoA dehydratase [Luteibacter rhizovicinus]